MAVIIFFCASDKEIENTTRGVHGLDATATIVIQRATRASLVLTVLAFSKIKDGSAASFQVELPEQHGRSERMET